MKFMITSITKTFDASKKDILQVCIKECLTDKHKMKSFEDTNCEFCEKHVENKWEVTGCQ